MAQTKKQIIAGIDQFTEAYITAALWSSTDSESRPLDENHSILSLTIDTLKKMVADCKKFQAENAASLVDYPTESAGHDFWLTRNHHGCGFWENDFGTKADCDKLTDAAHAYGEVNLEVYRGKILSL
jgi:hypothetical protein